MTSFISQVISRRIAAVLSIFTFHITIYWWGVRLDVEIIESKPPIIDIASTSLIVPNIYNLEPHLQKSNDFTRHNRYYQAKIDSRYMDSSERYFTHLPNLYIISITDYDPFGYDYMVYTVQNQCSEVPSLDYIDGLKLYQKHD